VPAISGTQISYDDATGRAARVEGGCVTPLWDTTNVRSIQVPELADLDGLAPAALEAMLRRLDRARRQLDTLIAETVGEAERSVAYAEDGHASVLEGGVQLVDR